MKNKTKKIGTYLKLIFLTLIYLFVDIINLKTFYLIERNVIKLEFITNLH